MDSKAIISKKSSYYITAKKKVNSWCKKHEKIFPFLFFITIIIITYYLFIYNKLCLKEDVKIAGLISTLGIGFAIIQFWVGEINANRRRLYDQKLIAYKEIQSKCNEITKDSNDELYINYYRSVKTKRGEKISITELEQNLITINLSFKYTALIETIRFYEHHLNFKVGQKEYNALSKIIKRIMYEKDISEEMYSSLYKELFIANRNFSNKIFSKAI